MCLCCLTCARFKDLADGVSLIFRASAFESFDKAQSYLQHKWPVLLLRAKGPYAEEEGEPLQRVRVVRSVFVYSEAQPSMAHSCDACVLRPP
jgi:hypothetical protein